MWNKVTDANAFVLSRAKDSLHEWKLARNLQQTDFVPRQQHGNIYWTKPNAGRYKCNIDASFSKHLNKVGLGMCIRDEHGAFVLAKTDWFSPICEVHIGEALGLISTLEWVHELNLGLVDYEMDAKRVVDSFLSSRHDVTEFGIIIQNYKTLFRHYYENSTVEFVRRQANELAKVALLSTSLQVLFEIPDCIENTLINEML